MDDQLELKKYYYIIRRWLWLIALGALVAAVTAYIASSYMTPVYSASTTLLVQQAPSSGMSEYNAVLTSERLAQTYSKMLNSLPVMEQVIAALGLNLTPETLAKQIEVELVSNTLLIRLQVEHTDPTQAARIANAVAQAFIRQNQSLQQERYADSMTGMQQQINDMDILIADTQALLDNLDPQSGAQAEQDAARLQTILAGYRTTYATLLQNFEQLRITAAQSADNVIVFEEARIPQKPIRPATLRNTVLAAVAGAMVMAGVVFLIEYLDDTIKSPDDVKRTLQVGILGAVPRLKEEAGKSQLIVMNEPRQPAAEAFRNLRTSIQYADLDHPARILLVTSSLPSDGKSFTAANLAIAIAQGGQSVILVDADLRRPVQHRLFGLSNGVGVTTAMLNLDSAQFALQQTSVDKLQVVTSGANAPNPTEILGSNKMRQFIALLSKKADVVILDSPPVLAFADAAVLSSLADGVVMVVDCGSTRRTAAAQAVERINEVGGKVLGVVLNRMSPTADGYYYYYSYYSHYYSGDGRRGPDGRSRNAVLAAMHERLNNGKDKNTTNVKEKK